MPSAGSSSAGTLPKIDRKAAAEAASQTKETASAKETAVGGKNSVAVDVAAWVRSQAEGLRAPLPPPRDEAEVALLAEPMAAEQVRLWTEPGARQQDAAAMRQKNPEWEFMGRSFVVWALANRCLRRPALQAQYVAVMDRIIDDTLEAERTGGPYYFLMHGSERRPFIAQPPRSIFVDGEIALMLAARRTVEEKEAYRRLLAERVAQMVRQMQGGPVLCAESHPDECWMFCNAVALAAIRLGDVLDGGDHSAFFRDWLAVAKKKLVDGKSGLLVSTFRLDGRVTQGPTGSSIWMTAHCLQLIDPEFAADQYRRARKELGGTVLGLGYAREWPDSSKSQEDLNSGAVIPLLEASPASSGLALVAARAFDDRECFRDLQTSLGLLAVPEGRDGRLRFTAGNQVGNAVILYAAVLGPLWKQAEASGPFAVRAGATSQQPPSMRRREPLGQ